MTRTTLACLLAAWIATLGLADTVAAADPALVLAPLVNDDTFVVGYADIATLAKTDQENRFATWLDSMSPDSPGGTANVKAFLAALQGLAAVGVEDAYLVAGLSDVHYGGGTVVAVPIPPNRDAEIMEAALQGAMSAFQTKFARQFQGLQLRLARHPAGVFFIGQQATLDRYLAMEPRERSDLLAPLTDMSAAGAGAGAVFSPGPDFRRVVRELWPVLPEPLTPLRGELADRWLRLTLAVNPQRPPIVELEMQATDPAAAELFVKLLRVVHNVPPRDEVRRTVETLIEILSPWVAESRVVMSLPSEPQELAKLQGLVAEATNAALESTRRQERMQQFKQMALAMYTYEDRYKHLPSAAIRDQTGRPLLSWRVAILPYVEQAQLYGQFRLDEPWDSPHNLALAQRTPDIYADTSQSDLVSQGKTTYVVPVGPGTVFDTREGLPLKDIKDGSSRTVMIVEVPPENAVIWTKPDDWEVNLEDPLQGITRTDRESVVVAFSDGSVHVMPIAIRPEVLRGYLTRAGGEMVDWP